MAVCKKIKEMEKSASFIWKIAERGRELKEEFGTENVFDFSLGNPDLPPPPLLSEVLEELAKDNTRHRYMPNSGFNDVRKRVASYISYEHEIALTEESLVMTCGASGALHIFFKTVINPGDRVLVSTPCFMEYKHFCDCHGGILDTVESKENFDLDIDAIENSITPETVAVIINSPNNPSGKIYPESTIIELAKMLEKKSIENNRIIYLISDEPYRKISFGETVPPVLCHYKNSVVCSSYSKDLSVPGERIGYMALNPKADNFKDLMAAAAFCNRILGYVNAPGIMQRVIAKLQGMSVDINIYKRKRDFLCRELRELGFDFYTPQGTFYLFVKAPNEMETIEQLLDERILVVPGSGFGTPGYFRIAFCVDDEIIKKSIAGFSRVAMRLGLIKEKVHEYSYC